MVQRTMPDPKMLSILVCPVSKGILTYDKEQQLLICKDSKRAYPVRNGIPVLLEEESHFLDE